MEATTVYLDVVVHAVLDVDVQNQKLKTSIWYCEVMIRRHLLVYLMSLLIPSIFFMLVDLRFYLPTTCRARIVFETSILVGYTVFRVNMSDKMPQSATSAPLIGVFTVCMAFLVLSLSMSILLVKFLHDQRYSWQEWPLLCLQETLMLIGLEWIPRPSLLG
ncbi:5-hydroxytryptamine receptor 3B [Pteropus alecto]|uniref:5-hydroxytryptamine receptor 3B n=1 Tax=Pteropus alecto TaxID=9402 RepID=L5KMX4_PTEAL|nr:5-hydroxytryptamine receptor 3B [Pteropus alecto]